MPQRVLVTGGAGYVGSALVPRLLADGYQVRVFDKLVFGSDGLAAVADRIELVSGDVRSFDPAVLDGVDAVVHLAGLSNDPTAEFDPASNHAINCEATALVGRACVERGVRRLVFGSSCSVYYTPEPDDRFRDEDTEVQPQAPYSRSKWLAEQALVALAGDRFVPVILRKGTVVGAAARMRYDLVVNTLTKDAFTQGRLVVHAGGRMWRPMLHIEDAVDAYAAVLASPVTVAQAGVYNVVSANYRIRDLAQAVRKELEALSGRQLTLDLQEVGAARSYRVRGERFRKTFGVDPSRDVPAAARDVWRRLEDGDDPTDPIHYNIRWLELLTRMRARLEAMGGGPL